MLEIRDLTQSHSKQKALVLSDVSLQFGASGMVFLTGDPASTSALLALCAGKERADAGEILYDGETSRYFAADDYDRLRGTTVHYVGDKSDLAERASVKRNLALGLSFGKTLPYRERRARIERVLRETDLTESAKVKIKRLSNAKRHLVQIARAVAGVRPILLIDETAPTRSAEEIGQALAILRAHADGRLILVALNDPSLAAQYGGRIVTLEHGVVTKDVLMTPEGVFPTREDDLSVSAAASAETEIDDSKENTDNALPFVRALAIGARRMWKTPVSLILAFLFLATMFSAFGTGTTAALTEPENLLTRAISASPEPTLRLENHYYRTTTTRQMIMQGMVSSQSYQSEYNTAFNPYEIDSIRRTYNADALGAMNFGTSQFYITNIGRPNASHPFFRPTLQGFAELSEGEHPFWQAQMLTDTDLSALGENDIVISSHTFETLQTLTLVQDDGTTIVPTDYDDIVGRTLTISAGYSSWNEFEYPSITCTVRGVFHAQLPSRFTDMLEQDGSIHGTPGEYSALEQALDNGCYECVLVAPSFRAAHLPVLGERPIQVDYGFTDIHTTSEEGIVTQIPAKAGKLPADTGYETPPIAFYDGRKTASLAENEIVVPFQCVENTIQEIFSQVSSARDQIRSDVTYWEEQLSALQAEYADLLAQIAQATGSEADALQSRAAEVLDKIGSAQTSYDDALQKKELYSTFPEDYSEWVTTFNRDYFILQSGQYFPDTEGSDIETASEEMLQSAADHILRLLAVLDTYPKEITEQTLYWPSYELWGTYTIVGFYYGYANACNSGYFFSPKAYNALIQEDEKRMDSSSLPYTINSTRYILRSDAVYDFVLLPMPQTRAQLRSLLAQQGVANDRDSFFTVESAFNQSVLLSSSQVNNLYYGSFELCIVAAAPTILFLALFLWRSARKGRRSDFALYHALGATRRDLARILRAQAVLLTAVCCVIAFAVGAVTCYLFGTYQSLALGTPLFVYGPLSWLAVLAVGAFCTLVASLIAVHKKSL